VNENSECVFAWRDRTPRPPIEVEIRPCWHDAWPLFRPYHYLSAELIRAARCYLLAVADRPAAFAAIINFPHAIRHDIRRVSRVVVLPDWQGLGLGMVLIGHLGGALKTTGKELRLSTASATFAATLRRSVDWAEVSRGQILRRNKITQQVGRFGGSGRAISVYRYVGAAAASAEWLGVS
jgi:GNAT superfamily N-acetyltransferase